MPPAHLFVIGGFEVYVCITLSTLYPHKVAQRRELDSTIFSIEDDQWVITMDLAIPLEYRTKMIE